MRKLKMIATLTMSALALACSPAPALADEVHPWCGVLVGALAMAIAAPEEAPAMLEAIADHPTATEQQKFETSMAVLMGVFFRENEPDLSDTKINSTLDTFYNACLKEHA